MVVVYAVVVCGVAGMRDVMDTRTSYYIREYEYVRVRLCVPDTEGTAFLPDTSYDTIPQLFDNFDYLPKTKMWFHILFFWLYLGYSTNILCSAEFNRPIVGTNYFFLPNTGQNEFELKKII